LIEGRVEFFLCTYERKDELGSNEWLREAEKEVEDGPYVVKPWYVTKFPFPEGEM
jgi:hypothetical protein